MFLTLEKMVRMTHPFLQKRTATCTNKLTSFLLKPQGTRQLLETHPEHSAGMVPAAPPQPFLISPQSPSSLLTYSVLSGIWDSVRFMLLPVSSQNALSNLHCLGK